MWVWTAFCGLSRRRLRFDQPQYIQFAEIKAYLDLQVITDLVQRDILTGIVDTLDQIYMDTHWEKEAKRAQRSAMQRR